MNWPIVEAGELMARRSGSVDPSKFPDEYFELHSIPAFDAGKPDVLLGRDIGSSKQIVQPDDVMISKIVPHIRRASVVGASSGLRQIGSGEWIVFRSDRIYPHYLRHFLISDDFNAQFMSTVSGVGGSLLRARPAEVAKIKVPLPPLSEQRRIAAILDKADALRAKRRLAIAKLDQLLQAVFLEMFGDPVTNPRGWPKAKMSELMTITRGGSPRPIDNFLGGEHHWIKIGDATDGDDVYISSTKEKIISAGLSKTTKLPIGSLVFANCGVSLGFARILSIEGCIHDGWLAFRDIDEKRINKMFLLKALNSVTEHFRKTAPSGTQPNLNTGIMKAFDFITPPLQKQKEFASLVDSVRAQKLLQMQGEARSQIFFNSVQGAAFLGQLPA